MFVSSVPCVTSRQRRLQRTDYWFREVPSGAGVRVSNGMWSRNLSNEEEEDEEDEEEEEKKKREKKKREEEEKKKKKKKRKFQHSRFNVNYKS